jgi:hypothetical protein
LSGKARPAPASQAGHGDQRDRPGAGEHHDDHHAVVEQLDALEDQGQAADDQRDPGRGQVHKRQRQQRGCSPVVVQRHERADDAVGAGGDQCALDQRRGHPPGGDDQLGRQRGHVDLLQGAGLDLAEQPPEQLDRLHVVEDEGDEPQDHHRGPASDELVRTALLVCGDCDMTSQFRIGVDLMIGGLDAYLQTLEAGTAAAAG